MPTAKVSSAASELNIAYIISHRVSGETVIDAVMA